MRWNSGRLHLRTKNIIPFSGILAVPGSTHLSGALPQIRQDAGETVIITRDPWDSEYTCRGRLWGGMPPPLPPLLPGSRILDLGCGDGKAVSCLVQRGCRVTALDRSSRAVHLCRHACPDPEHACILIADAQQIPFRDASFDVVIAFHVTGHIPHAGRLRLAGETARLLADGGKLFFRDFSTHDFRYGKGVLTETGTFERKNGISTHYFTREEVHALFLGLAIRDLRYHTWKLTVRGTTYVRGEIVAEFEKLPGA